MRRLTELLLLLLLLLRAGDLAALGGEVRFFPATEEPVWVGQELELYLELWSNGFSFSDQRFVLPEVRGAFLLQPDASTVKLSENRRGETWQGLRYTLLLYPQRPGRLEVPRFDVSFSSRAVFGSQPEAFTYRTPELEIQTRLPPGADAESLLVTTDDFALEYEWQPQVGAEGPLQLEVGDALTLEIRREAQAVPGMVFKPLPTLEIPGLAIYADPPKVSDRVNRGVLSGSRLDRITFVLEQEGRYSIPEIKFQWWDPGSKALSEEILPGLELEVLPSSAWGSGTASRVSSNSNPVAWIVAAAALLLVVAYPGRWLAKKMVAAWRHWNARRRAGEPWAFRQVISACRKGRAMQAYHAITLWLGRCEGDCRGMTLLQLARHSGNRSLLLEAGELQACMANGSTESWDGRELARQLGIQRRKMRRSSLQPEPLAPLNPKA